MAARSLFVDAGDRVLHEISIRTKGRRLFAEERTGYRWMGFGLATAAAAAFGILMATALPNVDAFGVGLLLSFLLLLLTALGSFGAFRNARLVVDTEDRSCRVEWRWLFLPWKREQVCTRLQVLTHGFFETQVAIEVDDAELALLGEDGMVYDGTRRMPAIVARDRDGDGFLVLLRLRSADQVRALLQAIARLDESAVHFDADLFGEEQHAAAVRGTRQTEPTLPRYTLASPETTTTDPTTIRRAMFLFYGVLIIACVLLGLFVRFS